VEVRRNMISYQYIRRKICQQLVILPNLY
jgi:hypothetical protein